MHLQVFEGVCNWRHLGFPLTLSAYLCNVLAALGQNPSNQLTQLELLFKADREQ